MTQTLIPRYDKFRPKLSVQILSAFRFAHLSTATLSLACAGGYQQVSLRWSVRAEMKDAAPLGSASISIEASYIQVQDLFQGDQVHRHCVQHLIADWVCDLCWISRSHSFQSLQHWAPG